MVIGRGNRDHPSAVWTAVTAADMAVIGFPPMSLAALPGRRRVGVRRFRPQPDNPSLASQGLIIFWRFAGNPRTVRTTSAGLDVSITSPPGMAGPTRPPGFVGNISRFRP